MDNSNEISDDPLIIQTQDDITKELEAGNTMVLDISCTTNMTPRSQFETFISKEWVYLKKTRRKMLFFLIMMGVALFLGTQYPTLPVHFLVLYLVGSRSGNTIVGGFVSDRVRKFRELYKLIGVSDRSYILSYFVFNFVLHFILITLFLAVFSYLASRDIKNAPTMFTSFPLFGLLYLAGALFIIGMMSLGYMVTLFIRDGKNALRLSTMIISVLNIVTVVPTLSFIQKSDGQLSWFDYIGLLIPQGVFRITYAKNFQGNGAKSANFLYPAYAVAQIAVYWVIIWLKTTYSSVDSGISKNLFRSKKRENEIAALRKVSQGLSDGVRNSSLNFGEDDTETYIVGKQEEKKALLQLRGVTKMFGDFKAVNNISCDIFTNTITCILGHNGAGKTTLINCICGTNGQTSGHIYLDGEDVYSDPAILAGKVGYCTATDLVFDQMTCSELLIFIACLKGVEEPHRHISAIMQKCGLMPHAATLGKNLSGGTKRRVSIATALIGNPKILVLDEPSSGIDPKNRRDLWTLILSLKNKNSIVLLTTHYLEEAEFLSEDVMILHKGEIDVRGTPTQITRKYGIGYRLSVTGLKNRRDMNEVADGVASVLQKYAKDLEGEELTMDSGGDGSTLVQVDDSSLDTQGKALLTIPIEFKPVMSKVLFLMDSFGGDIEYEIESNTLEEAFINLGETKSSNFTQEMKDQRQQVYKTLFKEQYKTSTCRIYSALVKRRLLVFLRSITQMVFYIYIILLPGLSMYLQRQVKLPFTFLYVEFGYVMVMINTTGSVMFSTLPYEERKNRMRYLLKILGVGSFTYYGHLFLADLILCGFMNLLATGFFASLFYDRISLSGPGSVSPTLFFYMTFGLMISSLGFAAQSYVLQFFISLTNRLGNRRVGTYIFLGNALLAGAIVFFVFTVIGFSSYDLLVAFLSVGMLISPIVGPGVLIVEQFIYLINIISNNKPNKGGTFFGTKVHILFLVLSAICPLFYLALAMLLDSRENSLKQRNDVVMDFDSTNLADDMNPIDKETKIAMEDRDDIPIQAACVSKVFRNDKNDTFHALDNVSLCLNKGETLGLLGPNGAGKTTMFNILSTYFGLTHGSVKVFGKKLNSQSDFFSGAGICAQDNILWDVLSVKDHLNIIRALKGIPLAVQDRWLELVGLNAFESNCPDELSSGMKRKLCFLISAMSNPQYKFLDEVSTGLDPMARKRIREMVSNQKKVYGGSTLFTTHTMNEAERACDRIAILVNGTLRILNTIEGLKKEIGGYSLTLVVKPEDRGQGIASGEQYDAMFGNDGLSGGEDDRLVEAIREELVGIGENGEMEVVERTKNKLVVNLFSVKSIATVFEMFEGLVKDDSSPVEDFTLSRKSLEDLFLALSRAQNARNEFEVVVKS